MSSTAPKIFITGATGYIGVVLAALLSSPTEFKISALVRNKESGEILQQLGVTPVYGSLDDSDLLFEAAKASDAVVNTASAEHLKSTQSLVNGLKAKNNKQAVYLHTSGTGILTFNTVTSNPFDDLDKARICSIPQFPQGHLGDQRQVDAWVFENTDDITAAIVAPSLVHGLSKGPVKKTFVLPQAQAAVHEERQDMWVVKTCYGAV